MKQIKPFEIIKPIKKGFRYLEWSMSIDDHSLNNYLARMTRLPEKGENSFVSGVWFLYAMGSSGVVGRGTKLN